MGTTMVIHDGTAEQKKRPRHILELAFRVDSLFLVPPRKVSPHTTSVTTCFLSSPIFAVESLVRICGNFEQKNRIKRHAEQRREDRRCLGADPSVVAEPLAGSSGQPRSAWRFSWCHSLPINCLPFNLSIAWFAQSPNRHQTKAAKKKKKSRPALLVVFTFSGGVLVFFHFIRCKESEVSVSEISLSCVGIYQANFYVFSGTYKSDEKPKAGMKGAGRRGSAESSACGRMSRCSSWIFFGQDFAGRTRQVFSRAQPRLNPLDARNHEISLNKLTDGSPRRVPYQQEWVRHRMAMTGPASIRRVRIIFVYFVIQSNSQTSSRDI